MKEKKCVNMEKAFSMVPGPGKPSLSKASVIYYLRRFDTAVVMKTTRQPLWHVLTVSQNEE